MPVWRMFLQRCPVAKRDQPLGNALSPNSRIHLREARKQVLEYGLRGSIEFGKDANLIILNGDPFSPLTKVTRVLIEGKTVYDGR